MGSLLVLSILRWGESVPLPPVFLISFILEIVSIQPDRQTGKREGNTRRQGNQVHKEEILQFRTQRPSAQKALLIYQEGFLPGIETTPPFIELGCSLCSPTL